MKPPERITQNVITAPPEVDSAPPATMPAGSTSYWKSLRGRLSLIFLSLFATILLLAVASVWGLTASNEVSIDVRDRWLPSTRLLGDLNNYTSDYRTAEADNLLAATPHELEESRHDMEVLSGQIAHAQESYEAVRHDALEVELYGRFSTTWIEYKALAAHVAALVASGQNTEAAQLYRTQSRQTYDLASDLLGQLTDHNVLRAAQASERSARAYPRAGVIMATTSLAAGLMLIFVVAEVRRTVSRPLLDLGETMRELAANNTAVTVDHADRTDEIGEMARAIVVFRGNAIELARSRQGLAQQAMMLEEKLAHEQQLARLQHDFISMISHEFRGPLTQIDAQAQRLVSLRDRLDPDDVVERASRMRAAVGRIVRLIDNLLDASRLIGENIKLFFHPEPIDLVELLRDVCRAQREISPDAQILEALPAEAVGMRGDPRLLFQAVSNLLANAIKYSPGQASVKVSLKRLEDSARIEVEDDGIGIPEQDREHIFAQYYRGSNVGDVTGTGVGLFFVATVARLHGGDVGMEHREVKGSRFIMTLPISETIETIAAQPAAACSPP
jgi:two-component system OmpR family sensor kinase